jgi:hypothetical protein
MRLVIVAVSLLIALTTYAAAAEPNVCPIQLQESQTQSAIIAQSRDVTEQTLAKALRANKELSGLYSEAQKEIKRLMVQLEKKDDSKAEKKPAEEKKAE